MFFSIQPDIYESRGILSEPRIAGFSETFITGAKLKMHPPAPLVFRSNFDAQDPPRGFLGMTIPVWSLEFIEVMRSIGIDNFNTFDAVIEGEAGERWDNYKAVNVLGIVAAANMSCSTFTSILPAPDGSPLVSFHDLVIDPSKASGLEMFPLAESPATLIVSERVTAALASRAPSNGWGVTAFRLSE
jgi:hypothetical protein